MLFGHYGNAKLHINIHEQLISSYYLKNLVQCLTCLVVECQARRAVKRDRVFKEWLLKVMGKQIQLIKVRFAT